MKNVKRFLAMAMALCLVIGLLPMGIFAATTATHMDTKPADGTTASVSEPFDTTVSKNYRIPGLVNHNGTLIASGDARWDYEKDGGGMDLVVSRLNADATSWDYTFAGYLGDNGNVWNNQSSTLMDPVIISDGETLYLLSDMYPAGYSISSSSTANVFSASGNGFDTNGRLYLVNTYGSTDCDYYLQSGKIYSTAGVEQSGYTVDEWFNVYQDGTYVSNLFFADSPFCVYPTSYIAMRTSTDGGESWSAPSLLNVKPEGITWLVLGPGSGLALDGGNIAFTAYDNSNIYLIWGNAKDGWSSVSTSAATNESSIIELNDGTIRAFVKRGGSNTIAYVDFKWNGSTYTASGLVDTGVENFSQCMVSSLHYSKTLNGKEVVLVCCPSKPGSGAWNGRFNGKIRMFTLDDSNTMTLAGTYAVNDTSDFFAYSNMAELDDGTIGLLYEDDCISYSAGSYTGNASHITFTTVDLESVMGVTFDTVTTEPDETPEETEFDVSVSDEGLTVESATAVTEIEGLTDFVAYDVTLSKNGASYTDGATVTIKLNGKYAEDVTLWGFVVNSDGSIEYVEDATRDFTNDTLTFYAPHFSTIGGTPALTDAGDTKNVTVDVGANETITLPGTYIADQTIDNEYVTVVVDGTEEVEGNVSHTETSVSYSSLAGSNSSWTKTNYYHLVDGSYYPVYAYRDDYYRYHYGYSATDSSNDVTEIGYVRYTNRNNTVTVYTQTGTAATPASTTITFTGVKIGTTSVEVGGTTYNVTVHGEVKITVNYTLNGTTVHFEEKTVRSDATSTTLDETITVGDNTYKVSNTTLALDGSNEYNVTVYGQKNVTVYYRLNGTTVATDTLTVWENDTTATLPKTVAGTDGKNYAVGNTTLDLKAGTSAYYVDVTEVTEVEGFDGIVGTQTYTDDNNSSAELTGRPITALTISEGSTFSSLGTGVTGADSIVWESANTGIATVDQNGNVTGVAAGETTVTVTVTKNGISESASIPVRVIPSLTSSGTTDTCLIYISEVTNTRTFFSLYTDNDYAQELVEVQQGEVVYFTRSTADAYGIVWLSSPNDKYVLTYMAATGTSGEYYALHAGDYASLPTTSQYYCGSQAYANMQSPYGTDKAMLDAMLANALKEDYRCDGAMSQGRKTRTSGTESMVSELSFISEPLPEIKKTVNGILPTTRLRKDFRSYEEGMVATVGEYIYYTVTITIPRPTVWVKDANNNDTNVGAITYTNAILEDEIDNGGVGEAYFYDQSLDKNMDGVLSNEELSDTDIDQDDDGLPDKDITSQLNAEWGENETTRTLTFFVVYEIVENDIPGNTITNHANLNFTCQSEYSTASQASAAVDLALITVVGEPINDVVVDFGLPITITGLTDTHLKGAYVGENAKYDAQYGTVTITKETNGTYTITYTPTQIIQKPDVVVIYGGDETIEKVVNGFVVYPATTVYYEEGFIDWDTNWTGAGMGTGEQVLEALSKPVYDDNGVLTDYVSGKLHPFGYDPIYGTTTGASNGSQATTSTRGAAGTFTFTGNGIDIYANCTTETGWMMVEIRDAETGKLKKAFMVNTVSNAPQYGLPVVTWSTDTHGTYTVTIKKVSDVDNPKSLNIDGIRVHNTIKDSSIFTINLEDNPVYHEMRDEVLTGLVVEEVIQNSEYNYGEILADQNGYYDVSKLAGYIHSQVFSTSSKTANALVMSGSNSVYTKTEDITKLLDNGPKNELFLYPGQSLTFKVTTDRLMQLGLKAPNGSTSYTITVTTTNATNVISGTISSSVDMFYSLGNERGTETIYTVTITNEGENILSVTDLKICDDPNVSFVPLTVEDIEMALNAMGYQDETEPEATEPEATEPEATEPEATEPEATEPEATEPEATEPEATEPEATEPEATEPEKDNPFSFFKAIGRMIRKLWEKWLP